MKKKPVRYVFKKGPEEHAGKESKYDPARGIADRAAVIQHIYDHGCIHPPDHERVCFREHFQPGIFEQLRLALIMNLLEFHAAKIKK